jgi:predicted NAD/FAD-binding protein
MTRVAVIGSGIAGLGVAHALAGRCELTLFEAGHYFGGHTHTVDVTLDGITYGVDTGFLVFNERTYPNLIRLFAELGVETARSDMSFSVQVPDTGFEWSGSNLNTVFAQRRNLLRPSFWSMLADLVRFNRLTTSIAESGQEQALAQPIGEFLDEHRFSAAFRDGYFLPMIGCIWSCPTDQMLRFPIATLIRFCHNHGLIQVANRPAWWTVKGGAREYVRRIVARLDDARLNTPVRRVRRVPPSGGSAGSVGVWIDTDQGSERFDEVVLACHSDQALALLADPTTEERQVLGSIRYHPNRAVLHTDTALMPRRRRAWAAWNYERASDDSREQTAVCLHYWLNLLQPLPFRRDVIVSLNPAREPDPAQVIDRFEYAHPVFDGAAIAAQRRVPSLQGKGHTWYCGAWTRYGFHEDGLMSALAVVEGLAPRLAPATDGRVALGAAA